ncbi:PPC domain-containing protein [Argonema galeatum]|uniref:PPC domain-containing protein n=1 Tax=Argonema galeatum TaxID=2942762 RepID=UPI002010F113|nr:PPC domain-containing protein [Argonema galeatum]MCL1465484.1 pre-peptidase C-terminal domain-containing protein [Argonema galeatum A003/A1]
MATNLFDANFYRALNPDLARAGITTDDQLRQHFVNAGANEGRQFSRFADLNYYAASYLDLTKAGLTKPQLFSHMETFSLGEKRRQGLVFNASYYAAVNPDLKQANLTDEQLTQHYQTYGLKEGRTSSEFFNARYYLDANPDLKAAFGNNFESAEQHFVNYGYREGRIAATPVAPASDPGNSPTVSYDLGSLRTRPTLNDFVGTPDPEDYYSFNLDRPSNLNLTLNGLSNNATLKLFADVNLNNAIEPGEELNSVSGSSSNPASINRNLAQGRYYVDVVTGSPTTNTSYSLSLAATTIPTTTASDPGSTPGTALNVDALTGTRNYQDFVGTTDRQDFYRFVLNNTLNNFNLSLNGVSDTAVANLYGDSNNNGSVDPGEFLASTTASSSSVGSLARSLGAGTYFVEITTSPIANTSYNLSLTA